MTRWMQGGWAGALARGLVGCGGGNDARFWTGGNLQAVGGNGSDTLLLNSPPGRVPAQMRPPAASSAQICTSFQAGVAGVPSGCGG